jgi:hypothetical protein
VCIIMALRGWLNYEAEHAGFNAGEEMPNEK